MSKNLETGLLLDIYGSLLTEKQYEVMDLYYNDDLSLAEIAEQFDISRQGVHDSIKRGEETLNEFEAKLGIYKNRQNNLKTLHNFKKLSLDCLAECRKVSFGKNIADKVIALLENIDHSLAEYGESNNDN